MVNLDLDTETHLTIHQSFDRIAADLIQNWVLRVNGALFSFTEIEFYLFINGLHEDTATHEHGYPEGQWRSHNAGLDITFASTKDQDGGILLRGIRSGQTYINGPRRVVETIFKELGSVASIEKQFGLVKTAQVEPIQIWKTVRHGLSGTQDNGFKDHHYRYYTDLEKWTRVSEVEKQKVRTNSVVCPTAYQI